MHLLVPVDTFAHDDRVDDDEAQHQHEAEQTQIASRSSRNSASIRNNSANPAKPLRSITESWLLYLASFCQTVSEMPSGRRVSATSTA